MLEQLKRQLGTPQEISDLAQKGYAPASRPKVNTHVHLPPNFSAFRSVRQATELAAQQQIGVLGTSNYYDYAVYADFIAETRRQRIFPLFGLEIISLDEKLQSREIRVNDPANPGKMYICGKGITGFENFTPEAGRIIEIIRRNDSQRIARMICRLVDIFDSYGVKTKLSEQAVIDMVVQHYGCPRSSVYLQERHVAQACQQALFGMVPADKRREVFGRILNLPPQSVPADPLQVQNKIRSQLMKVSKPAYVPESFIDPSQAYRMILEMGGIPCYPILADGAKPICEYEQDLVKLLEQLRKQNIHFVELIPIRNSPEVLSRYVTSLHRAGLAITSGTEHNTLEMIPIEPTCLEGVPIPEDIQEIFWEGACVVAAHQFFRMNGLPGFVDEAGCPNPAYKSSRLRIEAFASVGKTVIQHYYQYQPKS